ncbi:Uma2 family endonuclease [Algoriphagus halophytocola]|uniref:Uma2 family endonuclease n=1 Tax=Algoriphagus halophytocola TaxID=2991499 RepID=A0ABY6MJX6_9BACT|nr:MULTISPECIES: Uma2 family endonuclease [unclassified Algoriphagus]UZD24081.1 Uma2 family endonuclease [Algoriphagus sp. TR-M5]WBL41452.1 Uma2 family endonuclease [Algoriphagus sp. TR-M9]
MKEYRIPQKENIDLDAFEEPSSSFGGYSYADYLKWDYEEIVELIKGKVFAKPPFPRLRHQEVLGEIICQIHTFLTKGTAHVYQAPFDIRLSKNHDYSMIESVVQPDIYVIYDSDKLDDYGCFGAPDLIVEIISNGNSRVELQDKYKLYEEFGVREYWVVHPKDCSLMVYTLVNTKFQSSRLFTTGDVFHSTVIEGFFLDMEKVFDNSILPK